MMVSAYETDDTASVFISPGDVEQDAFVNAPYGRVNAPSQHVLRQLLRRTLVPARTLADGTSRSTSLQHAQPLVRAQEISFVDPFEGNSFVCTIQTSATVGPFDTGDRSGRPSISRELAQRRKVAMHLLSPSSRM
jgi:hypothetical protein